MSDETGGPINRSQDKVSREYYAEISAIDRAIDQLPKHRAAMGLRQVTLPFYCGDHVTQPMSRSVFRIPI